MHQVLLVVSERHEVGPCALGGLAGIDQLGQKLCVDRQVSCVGLAGGKAHRELVARECNPLKVTEDFEIS